MQKNRRLIIQLVALFSVAAHTTSAPAATSKDRLWQDIAPDRIVTAGKREAVPNRYRTVEADMPELRNRLAAAPVERGAADGVQISLPMPDGTFQEFMLQNSPIMAPELAAKFPDLNTYIGVASGDAATTGRFDLTPAGFHGIIFSTAGTIYIDPYQTGSSREYISYYKKDFSSSREPYYCLVTGERVDATHRATDHVEAIVGESLRTFRLAMAATGEFTSFYGGTVPQGMAGIVTIVNRVSGIYERELAVRLSLIANNDLLVYTNQNTDPYNNNNPSLLLSQNQTNIDSVIGSANYDIGHVFSTGGGGVASLGVVCNASFKARGETGLPNPIGDVFAVDFVAHEIGHQFGGNHTFNGSTGNCTGGNRAAAAAYEPGSGSTIQAYAGICGAENLQSNSDDYFHTKSFDEITTYIAGDGNCATTIATGNTQPGVDAGDPFTVPAQTPLLLQAAPAVDPDAGQVLTYGWEQFDLGAAGPPNTDDGFRPIFRSFPPKITTLRFLPRMEDILANTATLGESLPTTTRALTFRLTARDNAPGGGGVDHDTVIHQTTDTAGPFVVTSQDTPTAWTPGTLQTVTWDVANTDAAPVSCASVDILFSDQEFADFPGTLLLANTPNDGSEVITAPLSTFIDGRVMVKCTNNIFFNLNDAPISVFEACGNSVLDGGEQCDDGNTGNGDGCSNACQVESGWSCSLPVPEEPLFNALPEGGFESGTPNPAWTEASTNFGSPICSDAFCGSSSGPNTGTWFTWFGGIAAFEAGSVEQIFTIETTDAELSFALRIPVCDSGQDFARLLIDGSEVWRADGTDAACFGPEYVTQTIDLASAPGGPFNDGAPHNLRIESEIFANNGASSSFYVDDVTIERGGVPAVPSMCELDGDVGVIIVDKVSVPAASQQLFQFQGSWGANFELADATDPYISEALPTDTYSVTEIVLPGWDIADIDCNGFTTESAAAIELEGGEIVTCTFTNVLKGSILVDKATDPTGSSQLFSFSLTGTNVNQSFDLADATTPYDSGALSVTSLNGTYNVAETVPGDWDLESSSCDDDSPPNAVDLSPGEVVTCTFNNRLKDGTIRVDKVTNPPGSEQSFAFTTSWGENFSITDADTPFESTPLRPTSVAGTYSVTETVPEGWTLDSVSCDDGSAPDAIDLAPGEVVTCTFTNIGNTIFGSSYEASEANPD
jgi:cysteine-rich repeat protein